MKLISLILVFGVLSGCATMRDPDGPDAQESRRRVEAMKQAGTYQGPQMTEQPRNYAAEGIINGAGYLADKWGSKPQVAPSQAPCRLVPVTNRVTGQYDLVQKCD